MRFSSIRLWASIGLLVIAAGMPYCAAALGWAATQDATTITVRADVAVGVLVSWIGCAILAITGVFWTWRVLRSRREAVRA
jgi:hypothetical protein